MSVHVSLAARDRPADVVQFFIYIRTRFSAFLDVFARFSAKPAIFRSRSRHLPPRVEFFLEFRCSDLATL